MAKFKNPKCKSPYSPDEPNRPCGTEMRLVGERHPTWKKGMYIFECPRCETLWAIAEGEAHKFCERA